MKIQKRKKNGFPPPGVVCISMFLGSNGVKELGCVQLRSMVMGMEFCFVLTYKWQSLGEISPTEDPHLLKKTSSGRMVYR